VRSSLDFMTWNLVKYQSLYLQSGNLHQR